MKTVLKSDLTSLENGLKSVIESYKPVSDVRN